ncbi:MAG: tetratricopeptide repeat protein [Bacteroidota bacterium]
MTLPIRGVGVVVLLSTLLTVSAVSAQPATQYFAEGLARLQAGEAAAAIFPLEAALTADPALRDTYPALVVAHLQAGEPQRAEVVAAQGLERFPGDLHLTQLRAEASLQQGEVEAALPLYRVVHEAMEAGRSVPNVTAAQVRERLATVLQHAGGRAYEQGRRADAVAHYREARSLAPADEDIHANLAALHLEAEAWGDALDVAEAGLRHAPRSTRLLRSQAAALGRLGRTDETLGAYAALYARTPADLDVGLTYARTLLAQQRLPDALAVLDGLRAQHPGALPVYETALAAHLAAFDFAGALDLLAAMRTQFPGRLDVVEQQAVLFEILDDGPRARAAYATLRDLGADPAAMLLRAGRTYERADSLDAALSLYEQAAQEAATETVTPDAVTTDALDAVGRTLEALGRWDEALSVHERRRERADDAVSWTYLGRVHEALGDEQAAQTAYAEAVAHPNTPAEALTRLATITGQSPYACEALTSAVAEAAAWQTQAQQAAAQPSLEGRLALRDLASDLARSEDRLDAAFEIAQTTCLPGETESRLRAALTLYPSSPRLHLLLARHYDAAGQPARAKAAAQAAAEYAPTFRDAHLLLGRLSEAEADWKRAALAYERARALDPDAGDAYRALLRVHTAATSLDVVADRWAGQARARPDATVLCEHAIEALHKTERYAEARALAEHCAGPGS